MEWTKAKSIILFLLLAFNVFLLTSINGYVRNQGIPAETILNTEKILKARGVILECPIPKHTVEMPKLRIDNTGYDKQLLAAKLLGEGYKVSDIPDTYINGSRKLAFQDNGLLKYTDTAASEAVDLTREKTVEKYVFSYLKDKGLVDSSYILDDKTTNKDSSISLTYLEKYRGYLVYDNYARVTVTDKGITNIDMEKRHVADLSADKSADMTAAYQVLLGNFNGGSEVTITGIDIGYKRSSGEDLTGVQLAEQLSAWRLKIKGAAEPRYFSALDGKEIK